MTSCTRAALLVLALVAPALPAATGDDADPVRIDEPAPPSPLPPDAVVYHTLSGREAQVTFTSDAPLERIVGKTNAVVGYAIPGPADAPARLAAATWILPVRSLATGLPLRDEHMVSKEWFDAETYPTIRFVLSRVDDLKEIRRGEGFGTWSGTLVGKLTLHGVTRDITVTDARLSFLEASDRTKAIAPGDLLFLKCDYSVRMSEFGMRHPDVPKKVADIVEISQMLRLSNASPEAIGQAIGQPATEAATAPE